MATVTEAARAAHIARAIELATALGHEINMRPGTGECLKCLKFAVRSDLSYGAAATGPCPPFPVSTWNPYDENDTGQAYYLRLSLARRRLGLSYTEPP
jgi:hypothetical protein